MVFIDILQPQNLIGFFNNLEDEEFALNNFHKYTKVYSDTISDPYLMEGLYSAIKRVVPSEDEQVVYYQHFKIYLGDILTFNSFRSKDVFLLTKEGFKLIKTYDFSL